MKSFLKVFAIVILILSAVFAVLTLTAFASIRRSGGFARDEMLFEASKSGTLTRFFANDSSVQGEYIPIEIEAMTMGGEIKSYYALDLVSDYLKNGFIAVEDREFYEHSGVNFRRTAMATFNHVLGVGKSFGASTVTQQVIKNISGDNQPTAKRKILEILRALRIEGKHTKDEILELYLNIVPLGENIVGVGMGSKHYFGKEPSDLLPEEAAVLISLANAPGAYNPHSNPERCLKKRNSVLAAMKSGGAITKAEYERAVASELAVLPKESAEEGVFSWFIETVIEDASEDYARMHGISAQAARLMILASGYDIYTTQSVAVQSLLERYFTDLTNFPSECEEGLDFSMIIVEPVSGDLLGIVGSVGEKRGNLLVNHATTPHTPASTLKPLALYAPLIDSGEISWSSVFDDVPVEFIDGVRPYPLNSPNTYSGLITVKDALAYSKNTVAMRLYNMLGSERIYSGLKENYGIVPIRSEYNSKGERITDLAPSPLALGQLSRGVGLRKLTEAYSVFAADGILSKGRSYIKITDSYGQTVLENKSEQKRIYTQSTARIMNQLLMNVTEYGTAKSVKLGSTVDTAGKTGTSGGNLEKLFIGYTPYLAAGIRCSYNDSKTPVESVAPSHLAIWDEVMTALHGVYIDEYEENIKCFSTEGLICEAYCKDSGELFSDNCILDPRGTRMEYGYFSPQSRPRNLCKTHVTVEYDVETEAVAHAGCPRDSIITIALLDIPHRKFPVEVTVTDAEYVYRKVNSDVHRGDSFDIPYFYYDLPEGEYVGRGSKKKQYNHSCYLHD